MHADPRAYLSESLLGSPQEIAQRWAETYHFPMAPHEREDLPQVAQYLAVNQDPRFPRDELIEYLRQELLARYDDQLPDDLDDSEIRSYSRPWARSGASASG